MCVIILKHFLLVQVKRLTVSQSLNNCRVGDKIYLIVQTKPMNRPKNQQRSINPTNPKPTFKTLVVKYSHLPDDSHQIGYEIVLLLLAVLRPVCKEANVQDLQRVHAVIIKHQMGMREKSSMVLTRRESYKLQAAGRTEAIFW